MKTPRCEWALIGDGLAISANKTLLVWNKKTQVPELALVRDDPGDDPRGRLMTEDCVRQLNWDDYCHYCYVSGPLASSADKGLFVFAQAPDVRPDARAAWQLVWRGEPHERNAAESVAEALRRLGMKTATTRTGHPPKE